MSTPTTAPTATPAAPAPTETPAAPVETKPAVAPVQETRPTETPAKPEPLVAIEKTPATEALELPEGFDAKVGETLKSLAGELGLDGAKAKVLVERYVKAQADAQAQAEKNFEAQVQQYVAQAAEHAAVKELGGLDAARGLAAKALTKLGSAPLAEMLQASGLAYHPEVLAFFARVGGLMREGTVAGGAAPSTPAPSKVDQLKAFYSHPTSASMFQE